MGNVGRPKKEKVLICGEKVKKKAIEKHGSLTNLGRFMGLSRSTVYKWVTDGSMPSCYRRLLCHSLKTNMRGIS